MKIVTYTSQPGLWFYFVNYPVGLVGLQISIYLSSSLTKEKNYAFYGDLS